MNIPLHAQPTPVGFAGPYVLRPDVPPEQPLPLQPQDYRRPYTDPAAAQQEPTGQTAWIRAGVMLATALLTGLFSFHMAAFLGAGGLTVVECLALVLYAVTFCWIAFALVTALTGALMIVSRRDDPAPDDVPPLRVALLVLTFNEPPARLFGNATAMLSSLSEAKGRHGYDLFVLSDTTDPRVAEDEEDAFEAARAVIGRDGALYYRRRPKNTNRKIGNIADWLCRWGGAYDAFLVLDADSIMSARAIHRLTDELASDRSLGLVQSVPGIVGARTLFARVQQFSGAAVGRIVGAGAASWMGREANYFGHNAILHTRAFAASAHLPPLSGAPPLGGPILSHDFVEAAMLRRAGWGARLIPLEEGSYEETPPSLIDHVLRDRRWCQGNLQHSLLLAAAGLHPVSRFHLLHGIVAYLVSPFWALFLLFGMMAEIQGESTGADLASGQSGAAPQGLLVLGGTLAILLVPKLMGMASLAARQQRRYRGGGIRVLGSAILELVLSSVIAPILMVQQTIAVVRVLLGIDGGWCPQQRTAAERRWTAYLKFHAVETAIGAVLVTGMAAGLLTCWFAPVALSLLLAAPLSKLTSIPVGDRLLATPDSMDEPRVVTQSLAHARRIAEHAEAARAPLQILQAAE